MCVCVCVCLSVCLSVTSRFIILKNLVIHATTGGIFFSVYLPLEYVVILSYWVWNIIVQRFSGICSWNATSKWTNTKEYFKSYFVDMFTQPADMRHHIPILFVHSTMIHFFRLFVKLYILLDYSSHVQRWGQQKLQEKTQQPSNMRNHIVGCSTLSQVSP